MEDIVPELYEKIKKMFDGLVSSDEEIKAILNGDKQGTFAELYPMSERVGKYAATSLLTHYTDEMLPNGILYWNIMERTIIPTMSDVHKIDNQLAVNVQKKMDAVQKIGIKPQEADFPKDRVNSVMNMISTLTQDNKTDLQRVSQVLHRSLVNISKSVIDNYIQKNAEFRANAGMSAKIIRTSSGHCCEWCNEIAGTYKFSEVPKDVYRRHDNCDCRVEYICGKARSTIHSGREGKRKYVKDKYGNYTLTKEERIAKAKQMAATEEERKRIARDRRIKTWENKKEVKTTKKLVVSYKNNSKIELKDILIHRSVGAKAKNYDIIDKSTGQIFEFAEGTKIQNVKVFAGKGTKKSLHEGVAEGLTREFGGNPENWQHVKGIGVVDYEGEYIKAEVHWFQEETVGRVKFKIKEWLDDY